MLIVLDPKILGRDLEAELAGEVPSDGFGMEGEDSLRFEAPVRYRLRVQRTGRDLLVTGTLETVVLMVCDRCAEWFEMPVRVGSFLRMFEGAVGAGPVDLTPMIREDMILALPHKVLCRDDCKGLCSTCGANLNDGPCDCKRDEGGSPWAALDSLEL